MQKIARIAAQRGVDWYLYRPVFCEPPVCTFKEAQSLTLPDLLILHAALDAKDDMRLVAKEEQR